MPGRCHWEDTGPAHRLALFFQGGTGFRVGHTSGGSGPAPGVEESSSAGIHGMSTHDKKARN